VRIAFLSMLASTEVGATGVRTAIWALARALAERGHEVTVLTSGVPRVYSEGPVTVVQLGSLRSFRHWLDVLTPGYVLARLRYMWRAARYVRRRPPDLVEVPEGGFEQLLLLWRTPCKLVVRLHGNVSYTLMRTPFSRLLERIEGAVVRRADALYSPSLSYARMIANDYRIAVERIAIIPYGLDLQALYAVPPGPIGAADRFGLGDRAIVLFTGTLSHRKGLPVLLEVARSMEVREDVVFVLVGRADAEFGDVGLPSNVAVLGELPRSELCALYREARVFFMPSRFENLSLSIIEAMTFGLPVVAFDVGGNAELVTGGKNGYLIDPRSPKRIPELISQLVDDPERCEAFGAESRRRARGFSVDRIAAEVEALFSRVASAHLHE
jgi:glycosyltransferase involved in cell wall biosynthesis